jgi:hypothetical protein
MGAGEKERLPSNRHIDTFRRRRVIRDTESAISEQDERKYEASVGVRAQM